MRLDSDVSTVVDSDYAYIGTFLKFLEKLVEIMDKMFGGFVENLAKLLNILPKEE